MRSNFLKMFAILFVAFLAFSATAKTPVKMQTGPEPVVTGKYTAYWYIKSGDEYIMAGKSIMEDKHIHKSADNKFESVDENAFKSAVKFEKQSTINGKHVDKHFFIIASPGTKNLETHYLAGDLFLASNCGERYVGYFFENCYKLGGENYQQNCFTSTYCIMAANYPQFPSFIDGCLDLMLVCSLTAQ